MKQKVLIVEDDVAILTGLIDLLDSEGYFVASAANGIDALTVYKSELPDLILLDIMLPGKSGYDVCREIRTTDPHTPILMLTAKGQELDKVVGLELGADDYIVKPFSIAELLARIRSALRRSHVKRNGSDNNRLVFGNVDIDLKTMEGRRGECVFSVTSREIDLLREFMLHQGEVLHRFVLLEKIWGVKYEGTTRTLDQHIAKLRQKIEDDPGNPCHIHTVHGEGYRFLG
jgi:DNA-binding response OmpR family regulator